MNLVATVFSLAVGTLIGTAAGGDMAQRDAAAFRSYLAAHGLTNRWQGDPQPIDSPEIRTAYAGLRFYFTWQREPLPPGAPLPEGLAAYDAARNEYRKRSLRVTVGINTEHQVRVYRSAPDFNVGLMPVRNDEEAQIASAAIISLLNTRDASPAAVAARQIDVEHSSGNWICRLRGIPTLRGEVVFVASGRCVRAEKEPTTPRQVPR
jgi:hypothetical protein